MLLSHLQCEWLLGDRKPSPEELDKGIDPNSPLFQAILDNPVVQLGLTNPKTLLGTCAFLMRPRGGAPHSTQMSLTSTLHALQCPQWGSCRSHPRAREAGCVRV